MSNEKIERGHVINVLDHGYLKLVDYMGTDEDIVEAARQSTGRGFEGWEPGEICKNCRLRREAANLGKLFAVEPQRVGDDPCVRGASHEWEETKGDLRLLERLYSNEHATPFEACVLKIQVQAPIMVFREWHRHRTQSFSEQSARYIQMPDLHYLPEPSRVQLQSRSNKQGSAEAVPETEAKAIIEELRRQQVDVYEFYDELVVEQGIAKEVARLNTPVSRYSRMMASANLRNWLHFMNLRKATSAQWEIRQYAEALAVILQALFPRTWYLFEEYTFYALKISRTKLTKSREAVAGLMKFVDFFSSSPFPDDVSWNKSILDQWKADLAAAGLYEVGK